MMWTFTLGVGVGMLLWYLVLSAFGDNPQTRRKLRQQREYYRSVNEAMQEQMAEWKKNGWEVPKAPAERPVAGVMHALGPEYPPEKQ